MPLGVLRTKNLDAILQDAEHPEMTLNRTLGATDIIMLGIGAIIGAGIFSTVGTAAAGEVGVRLGAGPALTLSFIITAIVCGFTALCYAEFASMVPISGSAYTYSYATLGEVVAWIIGWDLIIEYAVGNVSVAISWAAYFESLIELTGINIPDWMAMDYRTYLETLADGKITSPAPEIGGVPIVFNVLAAIIVLVLTVLLVWGVRESARFNTIMVIVKIVILLFFIVAGIAYINADNYIPFAPTGFKGISSAAAVVFFAYIGFDAVSTVAEETREPQRNMPIGIIGSLIICTIFYVVVAAVFTGLISYTDLQAASIADQAEPLTYALQHAATAAGGNIAWLKFATFVVAVGAVIATTAVLLVFQMGQPRIFFSMARDGLLPSVFSRIHPKFRTPHITTILTGLFVAAIAGISSIDEMVDLTNIGTLFAFILVCAGVIILRYRDPDRPRPFKVPGGIVIPILGILSCLYLMYFLPSTSWFRFAAWLNLGFVIYIAYGAVRSRLTGRDTVADAAAHDAETAWAGASLGALGLLLMLIAFVFDVYATAKPGEVDAEFARNFRDPSWFLVVPLILNILLLYPVSILRAKRAMGQGITGKDRSRATMAIAVSAILMLASIIYVAMVLPTKLG